MDFTIKSYTKLLKALVSSGYNFDTFKEYLINNKKNKKRIILRHDVDILPENSLRFAKIQSNFGIKGTYYFRAVPVSWNEFIIKEIADLGHEIGYHYENMDICKGNVDKAFDNFKFNLDKLRKIVDVSTICMHGSPRSQYDNRDIWKKYDYTSLGLLGEPYFDINFDKFFYITDTGRRWDGWRSSIRDKVPQQKKWVKEGLVFCNTNEIIEAINNSEFPENIMFTMHPEKWNKFGFVWIKTLIFQSIKNEIKKFLVSKQ